MGALGLMAVGTKALDINMLMEEDIDFMGKNF